MSFHSSLLGLATVYTGILSTDNVPPPTPTICETNCVGEITSNTGPLTKTANKNATQPGTSVIFPQPIAQPETVSSQQFSKDSGIDPAHPNSSVETRDGVVAVEPVMWALEASVDGSEPQSNKSSQMFSSTLPEISSAEKATTREKPSDTKTQHVQFTMPQNINQSSQKSKLKEELKEIINEAFKKGNFPKAERLSLRLLDEIRIQRSYAQKARSTIKETDVLPIELIKSLRKEESYALTSLGRVYFYLAEYETALDWHRKALESDRAASDIRAEVYTLIRIAETFYALEKIQEMILYYRKSINKLRLIHETSADSNLSSNIGESLKKLEKIDEEYESFSAEDKLKNANGLAEIYRRFSSPLADSIFRGDEEANKNLERELRKKQESGWPFKLGNGLEGRILPENKGYQSQVKKQGKEIIMRTQLPLIRIGTSFSDLDQCNPKNKPFIWNLNVGIEVKSRQERQGFLRFKNKGVSLSPFIGITGTILIGPRRKCLLENNLTSNSITVKRIQLPTVGTQAGIPDGFGFGTSTVIQSNTESKEVNSELKNLKTDSMVKHQLFVFASQSNSKENTDEKYFSSVPSSHLDNLGNLALLGNLGNLALSKKQYRRAIEHYQNCLQESRRLKDDVAEMSCLNNLGIVFQILKQYKLSFNYHQESLVIAQTLGDISAEKKIFSNLGYLREQEQYFDEAISFYKKSVNLTETIRGNNKEFPKRLQQSYTETVVETYRRLADLLLSQGRILEAQQVLELLKIQEIRDYTKETRAVFTENGIQYTHVEQKIIDTFSSITQLGEEISRCEQTEPLCKEYSRLNGDREELTDEYNKAIDKIRDDISNRKSKDLAFFDPSHLGTNARKIVESQPHTMLIYPFVLEDKLWLLWVAPNEIVNRVEVPVTQKELGVTVMCFRSLLENPTNKANKLENCKEFRNRFPSDDKNLASYTDNQNEIQEVGKKLYEWLIQPLEKEISTNKIQTLVFSLDRVTRYIPMAALFDGKQYLVEKYRISTIVSAEMTNVTKVLPIDPQNTRVLALGLSKSKGEFNALPNVPMELDEIVRSYPSDPRGIYPGQVFLDPQFTFRNLADNLLNHRILHIATHGKFVPGLPYDSYLLLGEQENLTISRINQLPNLSKIDLAVLSACQTALGGPDSEGLEIAGLGYYFTVGDRAKAVMASLWLVNDSSTRQLMQQFYKNLATSKMSKAEALRQAQLSMIRGNDTGTGEKRSNFKIEIPPGGQAPIPTNLEHPFYWAPFILIGNGL